MTTNYTLNIDDEGNGSLTVTEDGEVFTVTSTDPQFPLHIQAATSGKSLADIKSVHVEMTPLTELSERVFVSDDRIEFDGEPVHDSLARTIKRYWEEGRPYGGLIKFMERLSLNTCDHSRNALWDWVSDRDLEIDNEGFLVAYKGVREDFTSVNSGSAMVDDVLVNGNIPNQEGSVISMPRSEVQHDPSVGCGTGLHVGTKRYAQSFGQVLLVCRVDPVDIVSVPTDCSWEKMRTCRYKVVAVHDERTQVEPTAVDEPGMDQVVEDITSNVPTEAQNFVRNMLDRIRGKR